jgi:hypothetical protein
MKMSKSAFTFGGSGNFRIKFVQFVRSPRTMRANLEGPAGRNGTAVNARATRRLDGKPRLALSLVFRLQGASVKA